jgi:hypothetical protein
MTESGLSCKVMQMLHNPLEYVFQSRIRTLSVDQLDVFSDVVNRQVFQWRHGNFTWIHDCFYDRDECLLGECMFNVNVLCAR